MLEQNILDEITRAKIYSLGNHSLSEAQGFLTKFRASDMYEKLTSVDISELDDEDIICLTLTRKAEDTKKIDINILKSAILNVYLKINNDLEKEGTNLKPLLEGDFDLFCNYIGHDLTKNTILTGIEAAIAILKAINYSQNIFFTEHKSFSIFRHQYNENFKGYLNLSGLDLRNSDFGSANLNDVDLTDTNLTHSNLEGANLDRALLLRTDLSHAKLNSASMRGTEFGLAILENIQISPFYINFLTEEFDKASLEDQLNHLYQQNLDENKHVSIFKSITENINFSLRKMKISFDEKFKLIDMAINHVLFGDQRVNTVTNWFNYSIRFFSFGKNKDVPTISLSNAQKDLIFIRNMLEFESTRDPKKDQEEFMKFFRSNLKEEFIFPEQNKRKQPISPIEVFIDKYGSCYEVLGIDQNSNKSDIEKQYKKLSLKYHPDRNKSLEAPEEFQKINNAKEILVDESKRRIHDQLLGITHTANFNFRY
ncbi:DnaJ domain-containing protein (plasmid) [Legionella sp. D16C41]|uniref:Molecular chaperone DnaJ n=1 Tax=Legionella beliardensis TaxID=91822 RepID=A0A378JP05_9GAMM|nr:DnaJ domain-containing protein [Legionella beliardensis]STX55493.1 molecular chaperone DnaJ [Legionella beliardensis]